MIDQNYFMNSFLAISVDAYNKSEHVIYCIGCANEFFGGKSKNIVEDDRKIGEFAFDFSINIEQFPSEDRTNILYEYITKYKNYVEANALCWQNDVELKKKQAAFAEMLDFMKSPLLSEQFIDIQKHLSLNEHHRLSSFKTLKRCYPDKMNGNSEDIRIFYLEDTLYIATDFNFLGLFRYYLDELYGVEMFPRSCMSCGTLFLSGRKHGNVLCSTECRKKKKSQINMTYYDNLCENEVLYTKIYRKWKQRIDRAEANHTINEEGIEQLREKLNYLIEVNRIHSNDRKRGNVPDKDGIPDYESFDRYYYNALISGDNSLYQLFNSLKQIKNK